METGTESDQLSNRPAMSKDDLKVDEPEGDLDVQVGNIDGQATTVRCQTLKELGAIPLVSFVIQESLVAHSWLERSSRLYSWGSGALQNAFTLSAERVWKYEKIQKAVSFADEKTAAAVSWTTNRLPVTKYTVSKAVTSSQVMASKVAKTALKVAKTATEVADKTLRMATYIPMAPFFARNAERCLRIIFSQLPDTETKWTPRSWVVLRGILLSACDYVKEILDERSRAKSCRSLLQDRVPETFNVIFRLLMRIPFAPNLTKMLVKKIRPSLYGRKVPAFFKFVRRQILVLCNKIIHKLKAGATSDAEVETSFSTIGTDYREVLLGSSLADEPSEDDPDFIPELYETSDDTMKDSDQTGDSNKENIDLSRDEQDEHHRPT